MSEMTPGPGTKQIHAGQTSTKPPTRGPCRSTRPPATPSTTPPTLPTCSHQNWGNIYTRIGEPHPGDRRGAHRGSKVALVHFW